MTLPALTRSGDAAKLPKGTSSALVFDEIAEMLPVVVRKTSYPAWAIGSQDDFSRAAGEILPESSESLSFFEIDSISALIAVAAFLNSTGNKEKLRGTFFFALPKDVIEYLRLDLRKTPADSSCLDIRERHFDLKVSREQAIEIVRTVFTRKLYNYRVPPTQVVLAMAELGTMGCREYADGPCSCCEGAA